MADTAGKALLVYIEDEVKRVAGIASPSIASTSHGSHSVSFFSPEFGQAIGPQGLRAALKNFHRICTAAVASLGASAKNAEIETEMLEDDYFNGATSYSVNFQDLRCA